MKLNRKRWCQQIFDRLIEGGVWAMPRSGMVFCRRDGFLAWVATFPCAEHLDKDDVTQRESEFADAMREFAKAGIKMGRVLNMPHFDDANAAIDFVRGHQNELLMIRKH